MTSDLAESDRRLYRKCCWLCLVVLGIVYGIALPIKANGLYPSYLTWLDVIAVPLFVFVHIGSMFAFPLWFGRRWGEWAWAAVSIACILGLLAIIWFERGWQP